MNGPSRAGEYTLNAIIIPAANSHSHNDERPAETVAVFARATVSAFLETLLLALDAMTCLELAQVEFESCYALGKHRLP